MKRPLAYITAAWLSGDSENAEQAARYCRAVYEAGFTMIRTASGSMNGDITATIWPLWNRIFQTG